MDAKAQKEAERDNIGEEVPIPNITGETVLHKKFGGGTIISVEDNNITVDFNGDIKKFKFPYSFSEGFLSTEHSGFMDIISSNVEINTKKDAVNKEIQAIDRKLRPLKEELMNLQ